MFQSWKVALWLLRKHLLPPHILTDGDDDLPFKESVLYEYAVLHWHEHVSALRTPPDDVLDLLSRFLRGIEGVTWSESPFEARQRSGIASQLVVQTLLKAWYDGLDEGTQQKIPIKGYFIKPHERLQKELEENAEENVAPYLPFMRLGQFFNLGGRSQEDWRKGFMYKQAVAAGFESSLSARHPLTLPTKTSMLQEFFWQRRFEEAEKELSKVESVQREIYDQDSVDLYITVQLPGYAQYSCARFDEAKGNLDAARTNYDTILIEWSPIGGNAHPLSIMVPTTLGMVCRKLEDYPTADQTLLDGWRQARRIFGDDLNPTVDTALSLALEYRDTAELGIANKTLEAIRSSKRLATDFLMALQKLIDQSTGISGEKNNRSLLWIRLTLATVLRQHEHLDEAAALSSEIVEPMDEAEGRFPFVPEPPERLAIAEQALPLVQKTRQAEVNTLLCASKLQWVRERDFDILQGGPITDIDVVKPVVTIATES
ncbi:uncharacterized protein Z519_00766 [Cladophialophora bantiana CBS 173.52]|uniref:MalT-like TPR region domain-containing protein n=1 Tax=Cladophialophora bantiana (strain ATCC 10958 / CBS 173.52 / CDC B-1940 / NIH 8579) TaxID=1442370 RepID=A0A0D2I066_CLAB1|nr:uncharacterized protein Z519_00766 [Cladophialophora bantiana CBS 173.52]KIW99103.1 hypothetical protein Z519_00766 [Cladophialophora bantiana CBS 173.52]